MGLIAADLESPYPVRTPSYAAARIQLAPSSNPIRTRLVSSCHPVRTPGFAARLSGSELSGRAPFRSPAEVLPGAPVRSSVLALSNSALLWKQRLRKVIAVQNFAGVSLFGILSRHSSKIPPPLESSKITTNLIKLEWAQHRPRAGRWGLVASCTCMSLLVSVELHYSGWEFSCLFLGLKSG